MTTASFILGMWCGAFLMAAAGLAVIRAKNVRDERRTGRTRLTDAEMAELGFPPNDQEG